MKITIHQPDLMPWLGFFAKINKADIWVVLDHTQNNPRDAAFWGRRVKMLLNGKPQWLSLPLEKPDNNVVGVAISEMKFSQADPSIFPKALKTIESSYKKAPFFKEVFPLAELYFQQHEVFMAKRNMGFIKHVMDLLDINTDIVYSSDLQCEASSTALLVEIITKLKGTTYLCGDGANGYQEDELFAQADINLEYNNFQHPVYSQFNSTEFIPGLSIMDALMNIGPAETKKLITQN